MNDAVAALDANEDDKAYEDDREYDELIIPVIPAPEPVIAYPEGTYKLPETNKPLLIPSA